MNLSEVIIPFQYSIYNIYYVFYGPYVSSPWDKSILLEGETSLSEVTFDIYVTTTPTCYASGAANKADLCEPRSKPTLKWFTGMGGGGIRFSVRLSHSPPGLLLQVKPVKLPQS